MRWRLPAVLTWGVKSGWINKTQDFDTGAWCSFHILNQLSMLFLSHQITGPPENVKLFLFFVSVSLLLIRQMFPHNSEIPTDWLPVGILMTSTFFMSSTTRCAEDFHRGFTVLEKLCYSTWQNFLHHTLIDKLKDTSHVYIKEAIDKLFFRGTSFEKLISH